MCCSAHITFARSRTLNARAMRSARSVYLTLHARGGCSSRPATAMPTIASSWGSNIPMRQDNTTSAVRGHAATGRGVSREAAQSSSATSPAYWAPRRRASASCSHGATAAANARIHVLSGRTPSSATARSSAASWRGLWTTPRAARAPRCGAVGPAAPEPSSPPAALSNALIARSSGSRHAPCVSVAAAASASASCDSEHSAARAGAASAFSSTETRAAETPTASAASAESTLTTCGPENCGKPCRLASRAASRNSLRAGRPRAATAESVAARVPGLAWARWR
jgi:hypothetical protein